MGWVSWESGIAKERHSGVIVKGQSLCGVKTETTKTKWEVHPIISEQWASLPSGLWDPSPETCAGLRIGWKAEWQSQEKEGFSHVKITGGSPGLPVIYCFHIVWVGDSQPTHTQPFFPITNTRTLNMWGSSTCSYWADFFLTPVTVTVHRIMK